MAVDWAAIAASSVGIATFAGVWYQSKRGASAADRDNRFQVLEATVGTLQRENQRYQDEIAANEDRYRRQDEHILRQDEEVIVLRRRHRESVEHLADAQMELGDKDRLIAQLHRDLAAATGGPPHGT